MPPPPHGAGGSFVDAARVRSSACVRSPAMQVTFRCDPALLDLLPRPVPARAALPDWLRAMAPRAPSELHGREIRTVKQCPPFVDAMSHGFMLLLPCDV